MLGYILSLKSLVIKTSLVLNVTSKRQQSIPLDKIPMYFNRLTNTSILTKITYVGVIGFQFHGYISQLRERAFLVFWAKYSAQNGEKQKLQVSAKTA